MSQDYEVDTDVLRAMAAKTRSIIADVGATDLTPPTSAGHEWVVAASERFAETWSAGLAARVTVSDDFTERLATTARVFDEGTDAAKAEVDAMIWEE
ncbi:MULTISPECIES: hypothetical protein [unclassified Microbacterium]|uniref:hypothetical protein n=1 Tax=unclassified Microbacterium TaxID=2609290 RepID=UPI0025EA6262|nr:hypothetical protein [Microbacterium sp. UBA6633]